MSAGRAFDERYADLRARYRAGVDVREHEAHVLRELHEAAVHEHRSQRGGVAGDFAVMGVRSAPPPWEEVLRSLGLEDVAAPVDATPDAEPIAAAPANPDPPEEPATRPLSDLTLGEMGRLRREVAEHVDAGTPSIRAIATRYRITRRQVGNLIAETNPG